MSTRPKPVSTSAKQEDVINHGVMTFSMIEKQALLDMDQLIAKEPTAARVLNHLIRLTEPGSGGVVIISRATLGKMLKVSDPTVGRAIRVLVDGCWIQRMRVGGAYALAVNRSVAWTGPRGKMDHAVFNAVVVASRDEQSEDALASPDLRRVPTISPGELVIPIGDVEPPAQELIPGTEPVVTTQAQLEKRGQRRLLD
jgi:hypothetical protein